MHTIPLDLLMRATSALKAAKDVPVQQALPTSVWSEVNRSHAELRVHLEAMLKTHPYVLGFINQVLNASGDLTDYMRVLPESVHHPISQMVATRPCRATTLTADRVETLKAKNQESIDMIKQRLVMNLLI